MLWLWIFMRLCVGYVSARFYKMFNTTFWKKISLKMMAFTFPIVIYVIFFMLNALLWGHKSYTVFALLFLWELMLDSSSSSLRYPVKTTSLYRQISQPSWYVNSISIVLFIGIFPFSFTSSLASTCWFSSFSLSLMLKYPSCFIIYSYAGRIIIGGGDLT